MECRVFEEFLRGPALARVFCKVTSLSDISRDIDGRSLDCSAGDGSAGWLVGEGSDASGGEGIEFWCEFVCFRIPFHNISGCDETLVEADSPFGRFCPSSPLGICIGE